MRETKRIIIKDYQLELSILILLKIITDKYNILLINKIKIIRNYYVKIIKISIRSDYKILTLRKIIIDLFFKKRFKTKKKATDIVIFLSVLIIVMFLSVLIKCNV